MDEFTTRYKVVCDGVCSEEYTSIAAAKQKFTQLKGTQNKEVRLIEIKEKILKIALQEELKKQ